MDDGLQIRLLILGGTAEAQALAGLIARKPEIDAIFSLAGATRQMRPPPLTTRVGGFGGEEAQADWMRRHAITHVIDATHPFAQVISLRTARLCLRLGIAYLQLLRPGWTPGEGDRWTMIDREEDAAGLIRPGATVFLATGRKTLEAFSGLSHCHVICRQIDPPEGPFPFPNGEFVVERPPFAIGHEVALFKRLHVEWLVVKDAGGEASRSKLDAARTLRIPVLMLRRPPQPDAPSVETVEEAMAWLER